MNTATLEHGGQGGEVPIEVKTKAGKRRALTIVVGALACFVASFAGPYAIYGAPGLAVAGIVWLCLLGALSLPTATSRMGKAAGVCVGPMVDEMDRLSNGPPMTRGERRRAAKFFMESVKGRQPVEAPDPFKFPTNEVLDTDPDARPDYTFVGPYPIGTARCRVADDQVVNVTLYVGAGNNGLRRGININACATVAHALQIANK